MAAACVCVCVCAGWVGSLQRACCLFVGGRTICTFWRPFVTSDIFRVWIRKRGDIQPEGSSFTCGETQPAAASSFKCPTLLAVALLGVSSGNRIVSTAFNTQV